MGATKKTKSSEESCCAEKESGYRSSSFASCCSSARDQSDAECAHSAVGVAQMNARGQTTRVTVRCNCGFHNNLFIRGEGVPGLTWQRGLPMKCIKADEWVWETDKPFHKAQFKILVNDAQYEQGNNHNLDCGKICTVAPRF